MGLRTLNAWGNLENYKQNLILFLPD